MVSDREDADLIACDVVDQCVRKSPHYETALAVAPDRTEAWILE